MTYLIAIWDMNVSATESFMLTEKDLPIEILAKKAVKEYLSYYEEETSIIKDLEGLINDRLDHYSKCEGCISPKKLHSFSLEPREGDIEKYGIDEDDYACIIAVNIIDLDQHPEFKSFCKSIEPLQAEKLVSTLHDFCSDYATQRDVVGKLCDVMLYEEEF